MKAREAGAKLAHRTLIVLFSVFAAFPFAWMLITTCGRPSRQASRIWLAARRASIVMPGSASIIENQANSSWCWPLNCEL